MDHDSIFTEIWVQNQKKEPKMIAKATKMDPEGCRKGLVNRCENYVKMDVNKSVGFRALGSWGG